MNKKLEKLLGNTVLTVIAVIGCCYTVWCLGYIVYMLITRGLPAVATSVVTWWNDTTYIITEHHWQFTDIALYYGIIVIIVFRIFDPLGEPESKKQKDPLDS